jgi:hypothetical protein
MSDKLSCSGAVALVLLAVVAASGLFIVSYLVTSAMMAG